MPLKLINNSIIFLLITVLFCSISQAKVLQHSVTAITQKQGLPTGSIRDILAANDKTIWLASTSGLVHFDGNRMKVYKHDPNDPNSLPSSDVYSLTQDSQQRIWLAANSRLAYYQPTTNQFFTITPNQPNCDIPIKYITKDHHDDIWGISESGILFHYSSKQQQANCYTAAQRLKLQNEILISSLFYDEKQQVIWLTTELGLERFDIKTKQSQLIDQFYQTEVFPLSSGFKDAKGNFWLGSDGHGVLKYDIDTHHTTHYSPTEYPQLKNLAIAHGIAISADEVWFAAKGAGILAITPDGVTTINAVDVEQNQLELDYAIRFTLDDYDNLWIAAADKALVMSQAARAVAFTTISRLNYPFKNPIVTSITIDNQDLLFISTTKGLYQLNLNAKPNQALIRVDQQPLSSNRFSKLHQEQDGSYYICSTAEPYKITAGKLHPLTALTTSQSDNSKLNLCTDFEPSKRDPNTLWVASHATGLAKIDRRNNQYQLAQYQDKQSIAVFSKRLMSLMPEHDDHLWITSADNGFGALNLTTNQFRSYQHQAGVKNSLPNNFVIDIIKGKDNQLWLTTLSGLTQFNIATETFNNYRPEDGLTSELLSKLQFDTDGDLWISSQNGINLLDSQNHNITRFQQASGVPYPVFSMNSASKDSQGKLYFGGPGTITALQPQRLKTANRTFDNFISQILIDEQPITHDDSILTTAPRDVTFNYGITAYASSSTNQFRYYLQGYDDQWRQPVTSTSATFSNLPYGSYRFMLQGKTQDGEWITPIASFNFTVPTPFYLSYWAFSLYIVIILVLVKLLGLYLTAAEKEKARILQQKVDEQTISLQQSHEKISKLYQRQQWLFAQLSHEIRTPITLMLAPIARLIKPDNKQHQDSLAIAQFNQNRLVKMLDQLLDIAQSGNLSTEHKQPIDVAASLAWIANAMQPMLDQKQQQLICEIENPGAITITKDALEKILLNLLSNANKYTQHQGCITLAAKQTNNLVSITVKDNGIGIEHKDQQLIFECFERGNINPNLQGVGVGLAVVKQLLAVNNGQISLESEVGKGSQFTVTFPSSQQTTDQFTPSDNVKALTAQMLNDEYADTTTDNTTTIDSNRPNILLAEDHDQMRQYIYGLLESKYNIITANNGQIGYQQALENVPDVIISDVMMPIMDGYQLLEQIKTNPITNHIPVLLLTAKDDPASRIKGLALKADDYIAKPFNGEELSLKIHNVLHLQKMWQLKYQAQNNQTINDAPQPAITVQLNDAQQQVMSDLQHICLINYQDSKFKLSDIAKQMHMTERQLQRKIKAISGMTPVQILRDIRLEQAKIAIENGEQITQVAYSCGFSGYDYFSRSFKEKYQITPKQCQENAHC